MNLNQAAHGDREHGFIAASLRMPRKVIAGYWQDADVQAHRRLDEGRHRRGRVQAMKVMRFGDNMREVAVTEGDKVESEKLGWQVNTSAVGDLVKEMNAVTEAEIGRPHGPTTPKSMTSPPTTWTRSAIRRAKRSP